MATYWIEHNYNWFEFLCRYKSNKSLSLWLHPSCVFVLKFHFLAWLWYMYSLLKIIQSCWGIFISYIIARVFFILKANCNKKCLVANCWRKYCVEEFCGVPIIRKIGSFWRGGGSRHVVHMQNFFTEWPIKECFSEEINCIGFLSCYIFFPEMFISMCMGVTRGGDGGDGPPHFFERGRRNIICPPTFWVHPPLNNK